MADRFNGTVIVGGMVTREQLAALDLLLAEVSDEERDFATVYFNECVVSDFEKLREYCRKCKLHLRIYWDAKYECSAEVNCYDPDGICKSYYTLSTGEFVVPLSELEAVRQTATVASFLDSLKIPELPDLQLIEYRIRGADGELIRPYDVLEEAIADAERCDATVEVVLVDE